MKGLIVYKGKYGATKQYADWLGTDLLFPVVSADDCDANLLKKHDCIIIGSSVYIGKLLIRKWMHQYSEILKHKKTYLFIVCATPLDDKKKLDTIAENNVTGVLHVLSKVFFLRGRLIKEQLNWKDRIMLNIGAALEKDLVVKKSMLQEFDAVKRENLAPLVKIVLAADPLNFVSQIVN